MSDKEGMMLKKKRYREKVKQRNKRRKEIKEQGLIDKVLNLAI